MSNNHRYSIGTLDYKKRRKYLELEAECHFENLSEAIKNGLKSSVYKMYASSLKNTIKCIDLLDKSVFKEEYGKYWNSHLNTQKRKNWEKLISKLKRK